MYIGKASTFSAEQRWVPQHHSLLKSLLTKQGAGSSQSRVPGPRTSLPGGPQPIQALQARSPLRPGSSPAICSAESRALAGSFLAAPGRKCLHPSPSRYPHNPEASEEIQWCGVSSYYFQCNLMHKVDPLSPSFAVSCSLLLDLFLYFQSFYHPLFVYTGVTIRWEYPSLHSSGSSSVSTELCAAARSDITGPAAPLSSSLSSKCQKFLIFIKMSENLEAK